MNISAAEARGRAKETNRAMLRPVTVAGARAQPRGHQKGSQSNLTIGQLPSSVQSLTRRQRSATRQEVEALRTMVPLKKLEPVGAIRDEALGRNGLAQWTKCGRG